MAVNIPDAGAPLVDASGRVTNDWYPVLRLLIDQANTAQTDIDGITFNSLSPTTTLGDLIVRGASTNQRLGIGTAADVLTVAGGTAAWAAPVRNQTWTTVFKTADETKTSDSTLANDTALTVALLANTKYSIFGMVHFETGATPDFKFDVAGPTAPTLVSISAQYIAHGSAIFTGGLFASAFGAGGAVVTTTTAGLGLVMLSIIVQNGANAGTLGFQWAQNTSNATATTVRAGSYLKHAIAA